MKRIAYVVLLLAAAPQLLQAQSTGTLTGRIRDAGTGVGIPGAVVRLSPFFSATTDEAGVFALFGLPAGTYPAEVSAPGFGALTIVDVGVDAYTTQRLDVELRAGAAPETHVFTPPIMSRGAGAPVVFGHNEVRVFPDRGPTDVARTVAGVTSFEGFETLHVRGGRADEVGIALDGVRIDGMRVPLAGIGRLAIHTGVLPASSGDALSGALVLSSRPAPERLSGTFEGLTSEAFDPFGYTLLAGSMGGTTRRGRLGFSVSAEYRDQHDADPRSAGGLRVRPDILEDVRAFPAALRAGTSTYLPLPATLIPGARLTVDDAGVPVLDNGDLTFSDGTRVAAQGVDPTTIALSPIARATLLEDNAFETTRDRTGTEARDLSALANLTWQPGPGSRLLLGGLYNAGEQDEQDALLQQHALFAPEMGRRVDSEAMLLYGSWIYTGRNDAFVQIQADVTRRSQTTYDPRFGKSLDRLMSYGDIDDPVFGTLAGSWLVSFDNETRIDDNGTPGDPSDDRSFDVQVPVYQRAYLDGNAVSSRTIAGLALPPGGAFNDFSQAQETRWSAAVHAGKQLGDHVISAGLSIERLTERYWEITARSLSRFANDGDPEQVAGNPDLAPEGYATYDDIPLFVLDDLVGMYYGYNLRGRETVDQESFDDFLEFDSNKPLDAYNLAPYTPLYAGAYLQDQLTLGAFTLEAGLRASLFNNNTRVLWDPYSRRPICRAGDLGTTQQGVDCGQGTVPAGIDDRFAVFYSGDQVIGYRDLEGHFFDTAGLPVDQASILLNGNVRPTGSQISIDQFEDYAPRVDLLPHLAISGAAGPNTALHAAFNMTSQRPRSGQFATLEQLAGTGAIANNNLDPARSRNAQAGVRHRIAPALHLELTVHWRRTTGLGVSRSFRGATPALYAGTKNEGSLTYRDLDMGLRYRPTPATTLRLNYILADGEGTEWGIRSPYTIALQDEEQSNVLVPLEVVRRHTVFARLDVQSPARSGPQLLGVHPFANIGLHVVASLASGFPYTAVIEPFNLAGPARIATPAGGILAAHMPATQRVDLRLDRRFQVMANRTSLTAFVWVQNLLDRTNVQNVWPFTGAWDNDGFFSLPQGEAWVETAVPAGETLYRYNMRQPSWTGLPRTVRVGLALDF